MKAVWFVFLFLSIVGRVKAQEVIQQALSGEETLLVEETYGVANRVYLESDSGATYAYEYFVSFLDATSEGYAQFTWNWKDIIEIRLLSGEFSLQLVARDALIRYEGTEEEPVLQSDFEVHYPTGYTNKQIDALKNALLNKIKVSGGKAVFMDE